ncbi:Rhs element Vgr protein [Xylanimonas cellulosilytica DSM 15894]|uniref:Rhs element Vgr protein n=1 Tax=Xylanimonas cellulosilytica (strain DSM 15894 / JCM 12276 / CECT 5975 / KCTC 9989 / LMG 20990 / NBRC 107835 / XIL07) TaxID=446471 RepID=D1BTJ3_XYLCX|nr:phage baseplate assembly protein V [Xylanimonas cellulosilytica]ACZ30972.1 Rhs element Vgr protein [Xylanimonas cellulosilytica DSM 15894]
MAHPTMTRIGGIVIALVSDVDDPDELGRVRLRFPWLGAEDSMQSGWVSISSPLAGKERGYFYLPEVDDEALVAFDHGDIDHPYVLGFLHNGVDKPPLQDGIDKHVRRVRSVSGHVLDLDDRGGKEQIVLKSQGGHRLELRDGDGTVLLASAAGQKVTMTDSPAEITVETTSGTTVTVTDAPSAVTVRTQAGVSVAVADTGVTVSAPTASVKVTALAAEVTATAEVKVTAPSVAISAPMIRLDAAMVQVSGVLQCSTLISQAVVSTSYTPGVGNLL